MVSLEDFVAETLVQIVRGSQRAQSLLQGAATVNPPKTRKVVSVSSRTSKEEPIPVAHDISFDVQVVATSGRETHGKAGVKLHVFSAGMDGQSRDESQHVSRVQFSIPLVFDSQPQEATPCE
jgi:hypothetical protein